MPVHQVTTPVDPLTLDFQREQICDFWLGLVWIFMRKELHYWWAASFRRISEAACVKNRPAVSLKQRCVWDITETLRGAPAGIRTSVVVFLSDNRFTATTQPLFIETERETTKESQSHLWESPGCMDVYEHSITPTHRYCSHVQMKLYNHVSLIQRQNLKLS